MKKRDKKTFGGYITDLWGVYHGPLGGISRTFGGYITDQNTKKSTLKQ